MAPEDRRASLVAVTIPLLREFGVAVSTRQIADAAGVAEGTIFGAFPDKASLLRAALISALETGPLAAQLAELVQIPDLRERLRATVDLLRQRFADNEPLIHAARALATAESERTKREFFERLICTRQRTMAILTTVFEPDRERLRGEPGSAARMLFMFVMANVHAGYGEPDALSDLGSDEIVSLLLDGLLVRPETSTSPGGDHT
jgi:AcrR family transcriptional regulator